MTHYLIGSQDEEMVTHIHADSQEEAVKAFLDGENNNGYLADDYDGDIIMVVPMSAVSEWDVEIVPPTEPIVKVSKLTKTKV